MSTAVTAVDRLAPTLATLGDDVRASLRRLAEAGFRDVQLGAGQAGVRPEDLDGSARRDFIVTLRRHEMSVSGLDAFVGPGRWRDDARVDDAVVSVLRAIELAADLGRCPVSTNLPRGDQAAGIVETIATHADRHGVPIADHAHPWHEAVPNPGMGIGVDPAAWLARGDDPAAAVIAAGSRLVSARLDDLLESGQRAPLGDPDEGQLDVLAYRVALTVVGYTRPVVADMRQWVDPWAGLRQTVGVWERLRE